MWAIRLRVDSPHANSLAASLSTEQEVSIDGDSFTMDLQEPRARDIRAIWNTRMRSLVIARRVIDVMDSSTTV
jgi:hypothetical protein